MATAATAAAVMGSLCSLLVDSGDTPSDKRPPLAAPAAATCTPAPSGGVPPPSGVRSCPLLPSLPGVPCA